MKAAIITMTLLGCSHGESDCHFIRSLEQPFASREQCEFYADRVLAREAHAAFPTIMAVCEPSGTRQAALGRSNKLPVPADLPAGAPGAVIQSESGVFSRALASTGSVISGVGSRVSAMGQQLWSKATSLFSSDDQPTN